MKQIIFKSIKIQNFLSVGNTPVEIDFKTGLHIITGINKDKEDRQNGVGKSTVADAVNFAVFGETLRDLKKEYIVNSINKKNCEVTLDAIVKHFDTVEEIRIVRTLEPSKCSVYINGEDKTRDSITNTNNFIMKLFNCTQEVFQNCVIMTINNTIPFMAKKKQEKRKFIEEIFNLSVFSNMSTLLKADVNENKKSLDIQSTRYSEAEKTLNGFTYQRDKTVEERKIKHEKYILRKSNNAQEITTLTEKINKLQTSNVDDIITSISELKNATIKIDKKIQDIRHKKSESATLSIQIQKQLSNIGTTEDKCPTCLRTIEQTDLDHIKHAKTELTKQITSHEQNIVQCDIDIKELIDKKNKIATKIQKLDDAVNKHNLELRDQKNYQSRIEQLNEWQVMLDQDIKDLECESTQFDELIGEKKKELESIQNELNTVKEITNTLDVVRFVVSEEGVKSYIVKKILQLFNSKLAYYLQKMDANCTCSFNEYFEEEIVDNKGKTCSYFNFSGAERKNIDLACLFTFMDMRRLQGDVCFNFSIYDELFDSSLDARGIELVIGVLRERVEKYNESIMVISHRRESVKAATGDIIFLEKSNGITKRVDYREFAL
jgi:DNA repair exonuclease SbcCD ATPase subunit